VAAGSCGNFRAALLRIRHQSLRPANYGVVSHKQWASGLRSLRDVQAKRVAIIQGHPDPSGPHFCNALAEAYAVAAHDAGHAVDFIDVAHLQFPLLRSRDDLERGATPEAIREAQVMLSRADHVVMIFPVWNGAMPALLKGFLEQAFRPAFIFPNLKPGEQLGFSSYFSQRKALHGKTARVIVTMQMPAFVYRWYFHPHPEKNTLRLSGLGPIRETLIGLVEASDGRKRGQWIERIRALGRQAA
jgi:putative NADPH-quinone reductase